MKVAHAVKSKDSTHPRYFVPSLYFSEGVPYTVVVILSIVFFKRMGLGNGEIALWTSLFYLPWVFKFLWSPWIDSLMPKRRWIWLTQISMGAAFFLQAWWLQQPSFFFSCILTFYGIALLSASHDIAVDGYYLLALEGRRRALYVGVCSAFYRLAIIFAQGGLVLVAGTLEKHQSVPVSWAYVFLILGVLYVGLGLWHRWALPHPEGDHAHDRRGMYGKALKSFFQKPLLLPSLGFILLYRLGESQLVKLSAPFLLDARSVGGMGLSTVDLGWVQGVVGVFAMLGGGILGGVLLAKWGLRRLLLPMWFALNAPNILYFLLALGQPQDSFFIASCVVTEQFGYGLGYSAYMLFIMELAGEGEWKTAHLAFCTGLMAAGMMIPGIFAGYLQESLGYTGFFFWVILGSLPGLGMIGILLRCMDAEVS